MTRRAWIILALLVAGCGGSTPTAPTPTAPTPTPVIPQVAGQYTGAYSTITCQETGAANGSGFCNSIRIGGGLVATIQQTGSNLAGTLSVGGLQIPVTGSVDSSGVVLSGSGPIAFGATLTVTQFRGTLVSNVLAGSTAFTIATTDPIGAASVTASFQATK